MCLLVLLRTIAQHGQPQFGNDGLAATLSMPVTIGTTILCRFKWRPDVNAFFPIAGDVSPMPDDLSWALLPLAYIRDKRRSKWLRRLVAT